jgi:hypothetical protein
LSINAYSFVKRKKWKEKNMNLGLIFNLSMTD